MEAKINRQQAWELLKHVYSLGYSPEQLNPLFRLTSLMYPAVQNILVDA